MNNRYELLVGQGIYYPRQQQIGLVYEIYSFLPNLQARPSSSILLCDGRDLGGFSAEEADRELVPLGFTGLEYQFTNSGQLHRDYEAGLFDEALHNAHVLYLAQVASQLRQSDELSKRG